MSCETFTTTINGHDYAYTQLSATKSLKLKYKLAGMLGTAVTDIIPALGKGEAEQIAAAGKAIQDVFKTNDPDDVVNTIKDIFVPAFRDKERVDFDRDFTNNAPEMYSALLWVLKCEYENFIQGFGDLL